jgi:hypothetical protein
MQGNEPLFSGDSEFDAPLNPSEVSERQEPSPSVNRPAEGARQVSPGDILGQAFEGDEGATDFLGLDVEFSADGPLSASPAEQPAAAAPDAAATDLDLALPTGDAPAEPLMSGAPVSVEMEPAADPAHEPAEDALYPDESELLAPDGDYDLEFGEEFEEEPETDGAKRYAMLAAAGFAVGLVLVASGMLLRSQLGFGEPAPEPIELAGAGSEATPGPKPTPSRPPATEPERVTRQGPERAPRAGDLLPTLGPASSGEPALVASTTSSDPGVESFLDAGAADPVADALGDGTAGPVIPSGSDSVPPPPAGDPETAPSDAARQHRTATIALPDLLGTDAGGPQATGTIGISPDDLDLIWRSAEVPMAAIQGQVKVLTPGVGNVRVQMRSGELFDGRLVAVGQGSVWIDSELGRIGLAGDRVESVDRLTQETVSAVGAVEVAMGERVRVVTLGGVIYGRVLKTDGEKVTLATEDGGRITLTNPQIETLGDGRQVILRD